MDALDIKILDILQKNARTPNTEIAKELDRVPSAILERIKRLEAQGIIQGYRARINPKAVELSVVAFVMIQTNTINWSDSLGSKLAEIPHIEDVYEVLGEESYLVKVRVKDTDQLSDLLKNTLGKIPEIQVTNTSLAVKAVKEQGEFPLL